MLTLERFYFNKEEIEVSGGKSNSEWHLMFPPVGDDGIHIKLSTLSRTGFRTLLDRIKEIGESLLEADTEPAALGGVGAAGKEEQAEEKADEESHARGDTTDG